MLSIWITYKYSWSRC